MVNALTINSAHQPEDNAINISPNLKNSLGRLFGNHPQITKVIVFGSRARGDAEERSDIDLAIDRKSVV